MPSDQTCCIYKQHGCPWKGKVRDLAHHQHVCKYAFNRCPYNCGAKVSIEQLAALSSHLDGNEQRMGEQPFEFDAETDAAALLDQYDDPPTPVPAREVLLATSAHSLAHHPTVSAVPAEAVALAGSDVATIPYKVLSRLVNHPLTDSGNARFLADWDTVPDNDIAGQVTRWLEKRGS